MMRASCRATSAGTTRCDGQTFGPIHSTAAQHEATFDANGLTCERGYSRNINSARLWSHFWARGIMVQAGYYAPSPKLLGWFAHLEMRCGVANAAAMIVGAICREIRASHATAPLVTERDGATGLVWRRLLWSVA